MTCSKKWGDSVDKFDLPQDFVVLASIRISGLVHSVIYSFMDDEADVVPCDLPEDTRWYQGLPIAWTKEQSFRLIQRAPAGEWGAVDISEVRNVTGVASDDGLLLFTGGGPLGRLVNVREAEHFLAMGPEMMNKRLGHISAGRRARVLHDGDGLVYRLIKDKPELRG